MPVVKHRQDEARLERRELPSPEEQLACLWHILDAVLTKDQRARLPDDAKAMLQQSRQVRERRAERRARRERRERASL